MLSIFQFEFTRKCLEPILPSFQYLVPISLTFVGCIILLVFLIKFARDEIAQNKTNYANKVAEINDDKIKEVDAIKSECKTTILKVKEETELYVDEQESTLSNVTHDLKTVSENFSHQNYTSYFKVISAFYVAVIRDLHLSAKHYEINERIQNIPD